MHYSRSILCVLGIVSLAAADEKCELSYIQRGLLLTADIATMFDPKECWNPSEGDDPVIDTAKNLEDCLKAGTDLTNKACESIDGLSAKSWLLEATCDGKILPNKDLPTCVPDECSIDDYQEYLITEISEGTDNPVGKQCTGDLSVTVDSTFFGFSECKRLYIDGCDSIPSNKSWLIEYKCDGVTTGIAPAACVRDGCSRDDIKKAIEEGEGKNCDGVFSVTVASTSSPSTFSRMNIIGSVGIILAGVVALM